MHEHRGLARVVRVDAFDLEVVGHEILAVNACGSDLQRLPIEGQNDLSDLEIDSVRKFASARIPERMPIRSYASSVTEASATEERCRLP